jgi:hypothetical protein
MGSMRWLEWSEQTIPGSSGDRMENSILFDSDSHAFEGLKLCVSEILRVL